MECLSTLCRENNEKGVTRLAIGYGVTRIRRKIAVTAEKLCHVILMG